MSKGFIVVALNNETTDYIACARVLAKSLRVSNPLTPVCLLTDKLDYPNLDCFDKVITFPHGDNSHGEWRLQNDWQVFDASPFDETIKIEADVLVTRDLSYLWETAKNRDVVVATSCLDWHGNQSSDRTYRQLFDDNKLIDAYNGLTYFKKTPLAKQFFETVRTIFENWNDIRTTLRGNTDLDGGSTDLVYAIAASALGEEQFYIPNSQFCWVHMKSEIAKTRLENWTRELVWELDGGDYRINTISQLYPVHYHIKELAHELEPIYDRIIDGLPPIL